MIPYEVCVALCSGPWRVRLIAVRYALACHRFNVTFHDHAFAARLVAAFPDGTDPETLAASGIAAPTGPFAPAGGLAGLTEASLRITLDLDVDELLHLARWHRPEADAGPPRARHYHYLVRPQRGGRVRVIEAPKQRLKEIQRRILQRLLAGLEVHPAALGGVTGRGVVPAVAAHAAAEVVICLDVERFFTSITAPRVAGWLRAAGADAPAAAVLARLVTNAVPIDVRRTLPPLPGAGGIERTWVRDRQLAVRHLPQGAPTSPLLANLICTGLDRRLSALAVRCGLAYTRYVDDLFLSGPSPADPRAVVARVESIVRDEGFRVAGHKTRVQRSSGRQTVLGAVVNAHPTLTRTERDAVKATVHNCRVHGWRSQLRGEPAAGFRDRLTGRVAWLGQLDAERGRRLRAELDAIDWT